jgi:dTDP-4-dehydrorhamnose reductase
MIQKPFLLIGARGQLGCEIVERARAMGIPLVALAQADLDLSDREAVARVISCDTASVVINAAAYTKVDLAESQPEEAFRTNAAGPRLLAENCRRERLPLIHISTDYVFDGRKVTPYTEMDSIAPLGVYGRSKAAGDAYVREALEEHVILRTSWVYGVHGSNFLKTILRLAVERREIRVVADQKGCPTGTTDLAEAVLEIAGHLSAREKVWGLYHFAGVGCASWHSFAVEIVDAQAAFTKRRPLVTPVTSAQYQSSAPRPANSELDCSKFIATFQTRALPWRERTRTVVAALLGDRVVA